MKVAVTPLPPPPPPLSPSTCQHNDIPQYGSKQMSILCIMHRMNAGCKHADSGHSNYLLVLLVQEPALMLTVGPVHILTQQNPVTTSAASVFRGPTCCSDDGGGHRKGTASALQHVWHQQDFLGGWGSMRGGLTAPEFQQRCSQGYGWSCYDLQ